MTHLTFEQISELAEQQERPAAAGGQAAESGELRHIAQCVECRDTLGRVREVIAAAHALPREITPPGEVWIALREHVARRSPRAPWSWWRTGGWAAAAAIVLLAGAAVLMPRTAQKAKGTKLGGPASAASVAIPVVRTIENTYGATLAELRASLEGQRHRLAPTTVRTVERSLAVIDTAIAEARAALAADPSNQALVDILSAHYAHKVDLLQRATELSPSL